MASLAIGVGGGAVGQAMGIPFGVGFAVFGSLAGALLRPHSTHPQFRSMASAWGKSWPIVYNNFRVAGQVIQAGPVSSSTDKKSGVAKYTQTIAVGFCEGPRTIGRIWADNQILYDPRANRSLGTWQANTLYAAGDTVNPTTELHVQFMASVSGTSGSTEPAWNTHLDNSTRDGTQVWITQAVPHIGKSGKAFNFTLRIYEGDETQLQDAALEELVGVGNQPPFRGLAYVVFENFDLSKFGNRIPNFEAEFVAAKGATSVATLQRYDNTSALSITTGTQAGVLRQVDGAHNRFFAFDNHLRTTPAAGIYRFDISSGTQTGFVAGSVLFASDAGNFSSFDWPLTITFSGDVFAMTSAGNAGGSNGYILVNGGTLAFTRYSGVPAFEVGWGMAPIKQNGFDYVLQAGSGSGAFESLVFEAHDAVLIFAGHRFAMDEASGGMPVATTDGSGIAYTMAYNNSGTLQAGLYETVVVSGANSYNSALWPGTPNPWITTTKIGVTLATAIDPGWSSGFSMGSVMYDEADGNIMFFASGSGGAHGTYLVKIKAADATVVWVLPMSGAILSSSVSGSGINGTLYAIAGTSHNSTYYKIDTIAGTLISTVVFNSANLLSDDLSFYDAGTASVWTRNTFTGVAMPPPDLAPGTVPNASPVWARYQLAPPPPFTLADICTDISRRVGLSDIDMAYTALASVIPTGCAVLDRVPARDFLESMMPAYFYDLTDIGSKIVGTLRSDGALLLTIPETDLAAGTDPKTIVDKISSTRTNDLEIPRDLAIQFYDFLNDYQMGSDPSIRQPITNYSSGRNSVSVPVVFTPTEAANCVTRLLKLLWIEREHIKLSIPLSYLQLTPADVIEAVRGTRSHFLRITKASLEPKTLVISMEGVSEDFGIYSATAPAASAGIAQGTNTNGVMTPIEPPALAIMDTATLQYGQLQEPGVYAAGSTSVLDGGFDFIAVQDSPDDSTFTTEATLRTQSVMGVTISALGNCPRWTVWDRVNSVDVTLNFGVLANASEADMVANFTNLCWMGFGEIIQFRDATLLTGSTWRLSTLLRGRFGTEAFVGLHTAGEQFVYIDPAKIADIPYSSGLIGATRFWQGVNDSAINPITGPSSIVQATRRLMPFAPYFIRSTRDRAGNIFLQGLRRMRWRGTPLWRPAETDTPVAMEIDVINTSVSPHTVVRTLNSVATANGSGIVDPAAFSAYYAEADQAADFGSPAPSSITIIAYELNPLAGRGYGGSATV